MNSLRAQFRSIKENLRTHGRDPRYRMSAIGSWWTHLFVIIVLPWLLMQGCIDVPKQPKGNASQEITKIVTVVKPTVKLVDLILSSDFPIQLILPKLDSSDLPREVDLESRVAYVTDPAKVHGALGTGDGSQAGYWDGYPDGQTRFIRLEYRGGSWDDGMDTASSADINFLKKFHEVSGGIKTASRGESHPMHRLKKYPAGFAPPFVYMTGSGSISETRKDRKALKEYLESGGMLFADAGSPHWHGAFRSFIGRLFPGRKLAVIADDDPIFRIPFTFPNGAPPFWHHGGNRALGIKIGGRWAVFYHPGDMNDAWKTGHSGLDPELADAAFRLGVNVVYYATVHYQDATREARKGKP